MPCAVGIRDGGFPGRGHDKEGGAGQALRPHDVGAEYPLRVCSLREIRQDLCFVLFCFSPQDLCIFNRYVLLQRNKIILPKVLKADLKRHTFLNGNT